MSRVIAELTLEAGTRARRVHPSVPPRVLDYAQAFFTTTRDSLRVLWHTDGPDCVAGHGHSTGERVSDRVAEVETPRGITIREVDILTLLALDLTNSRIAERRGTSANGVDPDRTGAGSSC